jgi:hypothetical protein
MLRIDIESSKIDSLSFVVCPLQAQLITGFFSFFLLRQFTVLMKQTRQAVCAIKQSIFLDVYEATWERVVLFTNGNEWDLLFILGSVYQNKFSLDLYLNEI